MFFNPEGGFQIFWELGKRYTNRCFVAWSRRWGAFGRRVVVLQGSPPGYFSSKSSAIFNGVAFAEWEALETVELH